MKKYLTVVASFTIMLCIGSVYAWSLIAKELISNYNLSAFQSQLIFGTLIALFPATMILSGRFGEKQISRYFGHIAGVLFFLGYFTASLSQGNFYLLFLGIGILAGVATGFGYWVALSIPVRWFPHKKGFITGIATAGFGFGAAFTSEIFDFLLRSGYNVLQQLLFISFFYGSIVLLSANLIYYPNNSSDHQCPKETIQQIIKSRIFKKLFWGIFFGTFAGLLIIGSLSLLGEHNNISPKNQAHAVALFSFANFFGRLFWGIFSDRYGASKGIVLALLTQSLSILSLNIFTVNPTSFFLISSLIGFGFGGNFVLFARETAQTFGVTQMGKIYPYVFLGYAFAGIIGPSFGGFLFDATGSFMAAIALASAISLSGSLLFVKKSLKIEL